MEPQGSDPDRCARDRGASGFHWHQPWQPTGWDAALDKLQAGARPDEAEALYRAAQALAAVNAMACTDNITPLGLPVVPEV